MLMEAVLEFCVIVIMYMYKDIFTVASSLADATREKVGWKRTALTELRWPVKEYCAGPLGNASSLLLFCTPPPWLLNSSSSDVTLLSRSNTYKQSIHTKWLWKDNKWAQGRVLNVVNSNLFLQTNHRRPFLL
jgi:hypothetical protein